MSASAHPTVATHLHVPPPSCDVGGDDVSRVRRAGVLADAARFEEAFAELDATCVPDHEIVRLARARTALKAQQPKVALAGLEGLSGPDAALWRGQALALVGRSQEAGEVLSTALQSLPEAPPQAYLDAAGVLPPEDALGILDLGLARRGPIGSLRRAAAQLEADLDRVDQAIARLDPTQPTDGMLRGDLLYEARRLEDARTAWIETLVLLSEGRQTLANSEARKTLLLRLDAP